MSGPLSVDREDGERFAQVVQLEWQNFNYCSGRTKVAKRDLKAAELRARQDDEEKMKLEKAKKEKEQS